MAALGSRTPHLTIAGEIFSAYRGPSKSRLTPEAAQPLAIQAIYHSRVTTNRGFFISWQDYRRFGSGYPYSFPNVPQTTTYPKVP